MVLCQNIFPVHPASCRSRQSHACHVWLCGARGWIGSMRRCPSVGNAPFTGANSSRQADAARASCRAVGRWRLFLLTTRSCHPIAVTGPRRRPCQLSGPDSDAPSRHTQRSDAGPG